MNSYQHRITVRSDYKTTSLTCMGWVPANQHNLLV